MLQVAIGQIHEQTIDSVDTVDDDDEVKKGMKYLAKGLERLRSRIPRLQFDLGGLKVESKSSEEDRVVEFTDFGSLTIKDTLSTRRGCVYSVFIGTIFHEWQTLFGQSQRKDCQTLGLKQHHGGCHAHRS